MMRSTAHGEFRTELAEAEGISLVEVLEKFEDARSKQIYCVYRF
jgi:hypothetical protein